MASQPPLSDDTDSSDIQDPPARSSSLSRPAWIELSTAGVAPPLGSQNDLPAQKAPISHSAAHKDLDVLSDWSPRESDEPWRNVVQSPAEVYDACFVFPRIADRYISPGSFYTSKICERRFNRIITDVCVRRRANGVVSRMHTGGAQTPLLPSENSDAGPIYYYALLMDKHKEGQTAEAERMTRNGGASTRIAPQQQAPALFSTGLALDNESVDSTPRDPPIGSRSRLCCFWARHSCHKDKRSHLDGDYGITRGELAERFRISFLLYLHHLECYIKETVHGSFRAYRVRLTEGGAKHLASRFRFGLQLDISVARRFNFEPSFTPPHMEYDLDAEPSSSVVGGDDDQHPYVAVSLTGSPRLRPRRRSLAAEDAVLPINSTQLPLLRPSRSPSPSHRHPKVPHQRKRRSLLWQRYDMWGMKAILRPREKDDSPFTLFRPVDRMRLLMEAISRYYDIDAMRRHRLVIDYFMLHQEPARSRLSRNWGQFKNIRQLAHQPVGDIREYFGEAIAFYFAWLGSFTEALLTPGLIGVGVFILQIFLELYSHVTHPMSTVVGIMYALYITCWGTFFLNRWETTEQCYQIRWGAEQFSSHVKRQRLAYRDPGDHKWLQWSRRLASVVLSLLFIAFVVAGVCIVFSLPYLVQAYPKKLRFVRRNTSAIISLINVTFITILDLVWCKLGYSLTRLENWRYEEDFQHSLVFKLFVYRFINYFNSFFYVAFMKPYIDPCPGDGSCLELLRWNLGMIFLSNVLFNLVEVGVPAAQYYYGRWRSQRLVLQENRVVEASNRETTGHNEGSSPEGAGGGRFSYDTALLHTAQGSAADPLTSLPSGLSSHVWETQFAMTSYDPVYGILEDYMEVVLLFGFVVLFSIILPIVPILVYLSNVIEIRSDAFKLTKIYRRAFPQPGMGIAAWKTMLHATCYIAIGVNIAISTFTLAPTAWWSSVSFSKKIGFFVIAEHLCLLVPVILRFLTPDEKEEAARLREQMQVVLHETIWGEDDYDEDTDAHKIYGDIPSLLHKRFPRRRVSTYTMRRLSM